MIPCKSGPSTLLNINLSYDQRLRASPPVRNGGLASVNFCIRCIGSPTPTVHQKTGRQVHHRGWDPMVTALSELLESVVSNYCKFDKFGTAALWETMSSKYFPERHEKCSTIFWRLAAGTTSHISRIQLPEEAMRVTVAQRRAADHARHICLWKRWMLVACAVWLSEKWNAASASQLNWWHNFDGCKTLYTCSDAGSQRLSWIEARWQTTGCGETLIPRREADP